MSDKKSNGLIMYPSDCEMRPEQYFTNDIKMYLKMSTHDQTILCGFIWLSEAVENSKLVEAIKGAKNE